jgi:glutamyl aminopeptidase
MNRQHCLVGLVAGLTVTCLGLIIGLATLDRGEGTGTAEPLVAQPEVSPEPEPEPEPELVERWEKEVRLPRHLLPLHYDLRLHPDLDTGLFSGRVAIQIQAIAPTSHFLVHTKHLTISETQLHTEAGLRVNYDRAFEYERNEFWVVELGGEAEAGNYTLSMEFQGNLTRGIQGFYRSLYTNSLGRQVPIATSKFQPTYARRAFPCFDEPSFKSTFSTVLVRPSEGYIALSNMPVDAEVEGSPSSGLTTVTFEKSVPMVTYLACFIVCDFEYEEKLTATHQTKFRVYATPQQKDRVRYALDIGANITDFFTDYYNISYPLPKQDMIAIPDFVSGAMEHWGLITYRETNLLYDERESSSANQQRVATVVSHELAHQWFGNLVTLQVGL